MKEKNKKILAGVVLLFLLCFVLVEGFAMQANHDSNHGEMRIIEYKPAPGHFVNTSMSDPSIWNTVREDGIGNNLTLGGFGGYVIIDMGTPIENHPDHPYGVDFTIFGNTDEVYKKPGRYSQEPAIVYVMKDENGDGLPNDTWYELAGSEQGKDTTDRQYKIIYTNPKGTYKDVPWTDSQKETGFVYVHPNHNQPYYPYSEKFPNINPHREIYQGTRILTGRSVDDITTRRGNPILFGYADCHPIQFIGESDRPDNPYTTDVLEGCGGDAFDLSWAIDQAGNSVELDEIRFIKVMTGVNAHDRRGLGEISSEISGIKRTKPIEENIDKIKIQTTLEDDKLSMKDTGLFTAVGYQGDTVGEYGALIWESSDPSVVTVNPITGQVFPKSTGEATITVKSMKNPSITASQKVIVMDGQ